MNKSSARVDWDCAALFYRAWFQRVDLPFCKGVPDNSDFVLKFSDHSDDFLQHVGLSRANLPTTDYVAQEAFINEHLISTYGFDGADARIRQYSSQQPNADIALEEWVLNKVDNMQSATDEDVKMLTDEMLAKLATMKPEECVTFMHMIVEEIHAFIIDSAHSEKIYRAMLTDVWLPTAHRIYGHFLDEINPYSLSGEAAALRDEMAVSMRKSIDFMEKSLVNNQGQTQYLGQA